MFKIASHDEIINKLIPLCIIAGFILSTLEKHYPFAVSYILLGIIYWRTLTYMKENKLGIYKEVE